jgi:hypothetical protein
MKRDLVYTLTNNKKHEIGVMLKSTEEQTSNVSTVGAESKPASNLKRMVTKKVAAKPPNAQSA